MNETFFIADAHFGAESPDKEQLKTERLFSFLDYVENRKADLVIVGDLFDFWFEYRYAVPNRHFHIISRLTMMCQRGIDIQYIAGNHDFWMGSFMQKEIGIGLHPDDYRVPNSEFNIYVTHGDGLLKNDYGYRFMKRVFRSKVNIFLYRLLHPDFGIPLALFMSNLSREASKDKKNYSDHDYRLYAKEKIANGSDIVVLGHTHWTALQKMGKGWYLNPGEWMEGYTFARIDQNGPQVYKWNGETPEEVKLVLPPGNPEPGIK